MFKKIYTEPTICIEDVVVENGIAASLTSSTIESADYFEYGEEF